MFFTNTGKYTAESIRDSGSWKNSQRNGDCQLLQLAGREDYRGHSDRKYDEDGHYLFMATKKGLMKKTPIQEYANVRKTGLAAITLRDDDELIEVK